MKTLALIATAMLGTLAACSSDDTLTQPDSGGSPDAVASFALAHNSWALRAPQNAALFDESAGAAPNSAGQWIVYTFGGREETGNSLVAVGAYNVATDTWSYKQSRVNVFATNGVAKIGTRLYLTGGEPTIETPETFTNRVWAYDYANDQLIQRADLPIVSGQGVSGAIDGKLYVLPGACSGERYPNPGYCAEERTRRFFRYNPGNNTWATLASSPHFHRRGAAGVIDGKLYVAAGFSNFTPVANLDVYDPATNSWKTLAQVPTGGRAIGAVLQGNFYVVTDGGTYAYNPATNQWTTRASPTESHDAVVKVTLNGASRLVAVGGSHGADFEIPNDTELYTP
jgi:hypothetical protein